LNLLLDPSDPEKRPPEAEEAALWVE